MLKRFFKNTLRWFNLLLVLVTLLAYYSPYINPSKVWHFSFLGLAYPMLLLGNVLFILFWAWRRNRYFLYSAACIVVGVGYFTSFIGLDFSRDGTTSDKTISVMTYNIAGLRKYENGETQAGKSRLKKLKHFLGKEGVPDVWCIQEGAQGNVREIFQKEFEYPHFFKEKGTLILSKFPIVDAGNIPFENTGNSCVWGDLKTPLGTLRVYSAHFQSNWLAPAAMRLAEENDPRKKETWSSIAQVMRLYKRAAARRAGQAETVAGHIAKSQHPIILCGDLNDTPLSYIYHVLSNSLNDSFCEKGLGFGFTYAGKIPALRIDYVLADKRFRVVDHQVPKLELSDHYPVFVRLEK